MRCFTCNAEMMSPKVSASSAGNRPRITSDQATIGNAFRRQHLDFCFFVIRHVRAFFWDNNQRLWAIAQVEGALEVRRLNAVGPDLFPSGLVSWQIHCLVGRKIVRSAKQVKLEIASYLADSLRVHQEDACASLSFFRSRFSPSAGFPHVGVWAPETSVLALIRTSELRS